MKFFHSKKIEVIEQDSNKFMSLIRLVTIFITFVVTLSPPIAYFFLSYNAHSKNASLEAKVHSAFISQIVIGSPNSWQNEIEDLLQLDLAQDVQENVHGYRYIQLLNGSVISTTHKIMPKISVKGTFNLTDGNGDVVAILVVVHSLENTIITTVWIFLVSSILGITIFVTLQILPLRELKRTFSILQNEKSIIKESEERIRIIIDNSIDGIITFNSLFIIESVNPAALNMFNYTNDQIIGKHIDLLFPTEYFKNLINNKDEYQSFSIDCIETFAKRNDHSKFSIELSISEATYQGEKTYITSLRDITDRKLALKKLYYLANYDCLTNLPNRSLLKDRLFRAIDRSNRNKKGLAVMFLDLDRFKTVNDSLGHEAGDALLKHVSTLLNNVLRRTDTVSRLEDQLPFNQINNYDLTIARIGGDEFVLLIEELVSNKGAEIVAQKILDTCQENPFIFNENSIYISTSIGIALYRVDSSDPDELIKQADTAMYRSKAMGRNMYHFFTEDLNIESNNRLKLENSLRSAIENNEFELYYQAKANASSRKVFGAEALIRWHRPSVGLVPPMEFIPILEETGLILRVGEWIIKTACKQCQEWRDNGIGEICIAINISARQFSHQNLFELISKSLTDTQLPAKLLEIEITESLLMTNSQKSIKTLKNLKSMGITISIDDFGTGYSSLSYLKQFPIDTLKIDQSFIRDIDHNQDDANITKAIIGLAHSLSMKVIAEGVETEESLRFLQENKCDQIQGYLLSKPLTAKNFAKWLKQHQSSTS